MSDNQKENPQEMRRQVDVMNGSASGLKSFIILILIFISAPLLSPGIFAMDDMKPTRIALPRAEAQEVIEAWMKQKGYEVTKEESPDAVLIKAFSKKGSIEINIATDSPLASVVSIKALQDGSPDPAELSNYLNAYMNIIQVEKGPRETDNSGNVVCIEATLGGETVNLTGFVADKKGLILCTAHYLSSKASIRVFTKTGKVLSGKLIKIERKKDIAFIDCNDSFQTEVDILKGLSGLKDSQKIVAFGCAEKNSRQIISGVISGNSRKVDGQVYWQAQMKVRPGDSGGPVFTENGVFVGIIKGGLRGRLDYTYIVPLDTILLFIRER